MSDNELGRNLLEDIWNSVMPSKSGIHWQVRAVAKEKNPTDFMVQKDIVLHAETFAL